MILSFYGSEIPLNVLREYSYTNSSGTSLFGLKKCMEMLNFHAEAVQADMNVFEKNAKLQYPCIAHVIVEKSYAHYVVVYGEKGGKLIIADPARGFQKKTLNEFMEVWTGNLLIVSPKDSYKKIVYKSNFFKSVLNKVNEHKEVIFLVWIISLILTGIGLISSYYFKLLLDYFIPHGKVTNMQYISIVVMLIYVIKLFVSYARSMLLVFISQKMGKKVFLEYIKHVFSLPMNFFSNRKVGEIISRLIDTNKVVDGTISLVMSVTLDFSILLTVVIIFLIKQKLILLLLLSFTPVYVAFIITFFKKLDRVNEENMLENDRLNSLVIDSLQGIETIKAINSEEKTYLKIKKKLNSFLKKEFEMLHMNNFHEEIKSSLELISNTLVLWISSLLVIQGHLSVGELITYNTLAIFFMSAIQNIVNIQPKLQSAKVSMKRLKEIHDLKPEKNYIETAIAGNIVDKDNHIKIEKMSFSYDSRTHDHFLKDISFSITRYSKMAIVGESGSGKSTLAKLLVKFYQINSGSIYVDGINVDAVGVKSLRKKICYVPQDSFLFNGSIIDNICFGLNYSVEEKKVREVCKFVDMDTFIMSLPLGYHSIIEEGGTNFSGGQRQKIAIARALLRETEILILDESTSSMDTISEKKLVNKLLAIKNKTIIFISHKLEIAQKCDELIVMNLGKVDATGSHDQLMKNSKIYFDLLTGSL